MSYTSSFDGTNIHYEKEGSGEITLCWVYGWGSFLDVWELQRPLKSDYNMIYIDLAGHGKSTTERKEFTMASFGRDVAAVIEAEDLSNVVLVGWSMGGPIILETTKLIPERIIGLIGIDSFFPFESIYLERDEELTNNTVNNYRENTRNKIAEMYDFFYNENGFTVDEDLQIKLKKGKFPPDHVLLGELEGLCRYDVRPDLETATHPIKAIMGGLETPEEQRSVFEKYDIDAVFLEGYGHALHLSGPELVNKHIKRMVKEMVDTSSG